MNNREEIIKELKIIVNSAGFLRVLANIARKDAFLMVNDDRFKYEPDSIQYSEIGYLIGLMVSEPYSLEKSIMEIDNALLKRREKRIMELLQSLHFTYVTLPNNENDLITTDSIIESTFYAESGAYNSQFLNHIKYIYRHDITWINSKVGFDIELCVDIFNAIVSWMEAVYCCALNEKIPIDELDMSNQNNAFNILCVSPEVIYAYCKVNGSEINPEDVQAFFDVFSYCGQEQYGDFFGIESQNIITERPIIKIDDSRYFIASTILLAKAIYSRPFYIGIQDSYYKDIFSKHIGDALEETTEEFLRRSFGKNNTYRNVIIESKKGKRISDADVLCVCDDAIIIAQCKNKRLTIKSKSGDAISAKNDYLKAIQDPYEQGCRIAEAIKNKSGLHLTLKDGKCLSIEKDINKVFVLCITSDYYSGSKFQEKLFSKQSEHFTLNQMSIFDLELTTKYLIDPYDFLYFLHRRSIARGKFITNNEINILGHYLEADLEFQKESDITLIADDFECNFRQDIIDKYLTGKESNYFAINRRLPREFLELIQRIETIKCDFSKVDISFFLRRLNATTAGEILQYLSDSRSKNEIFDFSMTLVDGKKYIGGLTFVTGTNIEKISRATILLGHKHASECPTKEWLSIGIVSGKIIGVYYTRGETEEDSSFK